jgi:uncharacterized membrane protein YkvA (DUF1232 family)
MPTAPRKDVLMAGSFETRFTPEEIAAMRKIANDQERLGARLVDLLKRAARFVPFSEDALAAWFCARDPSTPARVRLVLLSALAYFVLPIDAIPDLVPLLGFTDDAAVIGAAIATVAGALKPEHRDKARSVLEGL